MYQFVDTPSTRNFVPVSNQGCNDYVDMYYDFVEAWDGNVYNVDIKESRNTPEECAAAVRSVDGIKNCQAEYFMWTFEGRCYCPSERYAGSGNTLCKHNKKYSSINQV